MPHMDANTWNMCPKLLWKDYSRGIFMVRCGCRRFSTTRPIKWNNRGPLLVIVNALFRPAGTSCWTLYQFRGLVSCFFHIDQGSSGASVTGRHSRPSELFCRKQTALLLFRRLPEWWMESNPKPQVIFTRPYQYDALIFSPCMVCFQINNCA